MAQEKENILPSLLPAGGSETVTALAHSYRAEIARMAGWRDRIDRTSNWAITVVAALLSITLSTPSSHHGVLLFAMLLVYLLLMIEARRYRFFDVYRYRVRQFERHYFAQIFSPMPDFSANWLQILGQNLRAEILHFLRGRLLPQAEAQLHLDVPDPAARLGAENLDTRPAGREYQPHAGTLPAGDLADRAAGADTGRCRPCLRRALLHMAGLGFPPHASGFGGNRRRRGPCLGDHAVN